jgi:hypothetical protein
LVASDVFKDETSSGTVSAAVSDGVRHWSLI